jgi:hypothetical protein
MDQKKFLELFSELIPLKQKLASTVDYRSLRFTYQDIIGFFDEKLLHVFTKYPDLPYEEVKAITITSLHTLRSRIYRQYGREINMEEPSWVPAPAEEEDYLAQLQHLIENLEKHLTPDQWVLAKLLFTPPMYVLSRVKNQDKRIPSHLFLEFLGMPSAKQEVKHFNKFRKRLYLFIRDNFSQETLEYIPRIA